MEEKDILNSQYEVEYDNLIEDYVVKEKRNTGNSLFKLKTKKMQQPPRPNNLPPNMPPPPYPEFNYAVFLSRRIYWQMVTTINLYEQLRNNNQSTRTTFNNMISQLELLRITMYNIYRRLSGSNFIFGSAENINLTGDFCIDLSTTYDYVQDLNTNLFYLQRLVDIPNINRQLIIMLTTITGQLNTIDSLITNNC
ncbi:MAG: hypothetical protein E7359_02940 [Clostridiales bacterium]|nr:hypothetical protein [Clostridiales bacterium]